MCNEIWILNIVLWVVTIAIAIRANKGASKAIEHIRTVNNELTELRKEHSEDLRSVYQLRNYLINTDPLFKAHVIEEKYKKHKKYDEYSSYNCGTYTHHTEQELIQFTKEVIGLNCKKCSEVIK